ARPGGRIGVTAEQPRFDLADPVDFVVVGAGAAGGIMAKELAEAGFRVVVLEQGPYLKEKDFRHDEFRHIWQAAMINDRRLEPNYTKAEWELGVSGLQGASPFDPPRSKPYPVPPLPVKSSGVLCERAARKLGWHAFPAPMAIISQPYRGRSGCFHCGYCELF